MTSRDTNRRASCGDFTRPEDELLATLLPVETPSEELPIAYAIPVSTRTPSSQAGIASNSHNLRLSQEQSLQRTRVQDVMVIPPPPSDNVYRENSGGRLSLAQQQGLQAAYEESLHISQNNLRVEAYNNQIELEVHRANEIARIENQRERQLQNSTISTPPLPTSSTMASGTGGKRPSEEAYFPPPGAGGYQVKEYDIREQEGDYSYDIGDHNIDYGDTP
jgi:hypothetical protein